MGGNQTLRGSSFDPILEAGIRFWEVFSTFYPFCLLSDVDVRGVLSSLSDFGVSFFEISMYQVESET